MKSKKFVTSIIFILILINIMSIFSGNSVNSNNNRILNFSSPISLNFSRSASLDQLFIKRLLTDDLKAIDSNIVISETKSGDDIPLYLDNEIGEHLWEDEYNVFYIKLEKGSYQINVTTSWDMDLVLSYSDSALFTKILDESDIPGYGYSESITFGFNYTKTVYFKVLAKNGSGYYDIIVTKIGEYVAPPDENTQSSENTQLSEDTLTIIYMVIIIISIVLGIAAFFLLKVDKKIQSIPRYFKEKKQEKQKVKELEANRYENLIELEANRYENLIKMSKELAEKGKKEYSNESYNNAIQIWNESIDSYILAQEKSRSESEKTKIEGNIRILKENICNALIEDGKKRNLTAKKAHEQENLQKAEEEWKLANTKFQLAIDSIKSEKSAIPLKNLEAIMNAITLNLQQLEIEKICFDADKKLKQVDALKDENLTEAINICHETIVQYIKAKDMAEKRAEFEVVARDIQTKIINSRSIQSQLEDKRDELMNISLVRTETVLDETLPSNIKAPTLIKAEKLPDPITVIRDYDLVGGKIRFKMSIANNTSSPLTSFKISFDFPKALKLITHEPNYERIGDSIKIPKIGKDDILVFSLFLEPMDCVVSPIHATIIYFDAKDKAHAVIMEPKIVEIICPMFLTLEAVNVASVKNYHQHLNHKDKKVFAISDVSKCSEIFNSVLIVLGEYDIKLVYKEYSERGNAGEAWFYGVTKKDKDKVIAHVIIDGSNRVLEIEVSGDDDRKVTSFLAKIRNSVKALLIKSKILKPESEFDDIISSIRLNQCPQCSGKISMELVDDFFKGKSITCKYCGYYIRS